MTVTPTAAVGTASAGTGAVTAAAITADAAPGRLRRTFSRASLRRVGYALLALPIGLAGLPAAVGRGSADRQRRLVQRMLGLPSVPVSRPRVLLHALLSTPLNLASAVLTGYSWWFAVVNLAYPIRPLLGIPGYTANSWGGPSYAGVWAFHALVGGVPLALATCALALGLTSLQRRAARRLLG